MKFTGGLSTLLVVLPFLALQVSAAPSASLDARAQGGNRANNRANNRAGGRGGNKNAGAGAAAGAAAGAGGAAAALPGQNSTITGSTATSASNATNTNNANQGAGAAGAAGAGGNPQTSLTLDPSVIGPNLAQNGLNGNGTEAGQVASITSTNNFINFCVGKTITNGLQIQGGSCNPVPMGDLPPKTNQPACKFQFPTNMANVGENTAFTIKMAIQGLTTGNFVNPNTNYFGAPQQLDGSNTIIGHSHVVIQSLPSITSTQPLDPNTFAFFLGLNAKAQNGVLTADVTKGLPAGTYRLFSINTAANHQPVSGPVAQHGGFDDAVYFTVGSAAAQAAAQAAGAAGAANNGTANAGAAAGGAAGGAGGGAANNGTANAGAGAAGGAAGGAANNGTANAGAGAAAGGAGAGKANAGAAGGAAKKGNAGAGGATTKAGSAAQKGVPSTQAGAAAVKGFAPTGKRRSFTISRQN